MRTRYANWTLALLLAGILAALPRPCGSATLLKYSITDLGTLGGDISMAYDVNEQGAVAGKSRTADGTFTAFYWDSTSGMVKIGPGAALGLNDHGQVAGNYHHHTDDAFVWDAVDGLVFLNKGDFLFVTANAVCNSGKAVGYARKYNDVDGTRALLWDPASDSFTILEGLESPLYANAINGLEEVVGNSGDPSRAFIWNHSEGMKDLGVLNDEGWSYHATDINDLGQVVGYVRTASDEYHAFIQDRNAGMRLLSGEGESRALAVNRHGHAVGAQGTLIGLEGTAYLWKNEERIDLNEVIPSDSGWELRDARGITDRGLICGTGLINGQLHAFLLEPIGSTEADVKANGSDSPVTVKSTEVVSITVSLDPGSHSGETADWWIAARTSFDPPGNWYSYIYPTGWMPGISLCVQTGLVALSRFEVLNMSLPPGNYTFYFALDDHDGAATGPWWTLDSVEVTVE